MPNRIRFLSVLGALALVVAACGTSEEGAVPPGAASGDRPVAGACLEDEPVCQDTFTDSGEPTGNPSPGVPVGTVVATQIDGGFAIEGFYFADEAGERICEALAESFPPQCGGPSIAFDNTAGADLGVLSVEQGVTWSDQPILVTGQVVDGVFVADGR